MKINVEPNPSLDITEILPPIFNTRPLQIANPNRLLARNRLIARTEQRYYPIHPWECHSLYPRHKNLTIFPSASSVYPNQILPFLVCLTAFVNKFMQICYNRFRSILNMISGTCIQGYFHPSGLRNCMELYISFIKEG